MGRVAMFNDTHVRCSACREWLPREVFTVDRSRPSGTQSYCRPCSAAHRRERYANDTDYRASERARRKARYDADPAGQNAKRMAWAKANPEKQAAGLRRHVERNREQYRIKWTRHRITRQARGGVDSEWLTTLRSDPCAYCGGVAGTIDHIDPVIRGGLSEHDNLTAACQSCNSRKSSTPLLFALVRMNGLRA